MIDKPMTQEELEAHEAQVEKNQAAEDKLRRKKSAPAYTQKEAEAKLDELNLTNEPKLRNQRHEWFIERHIRLIFFEGLVFFCPEDTNSSEVLSRIDTMNTLRRQLLEHAKWIKAKGLNVELVEKVYKLRKKSVQPHE